MNTTSDRPESRTSAWRAWSLFLVTSIGASIVGLASSGAQDVGKEKGGGTTPAPDNAPRAAADEAAARTKRFHFPVRFAKPAELAAALKHYFQADADFRLADPDSNVLLINVTPGAQDEVAKTLAQLDRAPRPVAIDVVVVEFDAGPERDARTGVPRSEWDMRDLSGPIEKVQEKLAELAKAGKIVAVKRLRADAIENRPSTVQTGEERPRVGNVTVNATTGNAFPIVEQRSTGTILQVTPRIVSDSDLILDLTLRDDRLHVPERPFVLGKGIDGPVISPEILTANLTQKLAIKSGHAVVAQGVQNDSASKALRFVMIVMARVGEAPEKK